MKITEMNNCIEEMRKCYKFEDDKTEIRLGSVPSSGCDRHVFVSTMNENGTQIEMTRIADRLEEADHFSKQPIENMSITVTNERTITGNANALCATKRFITAK